jgi:hypothetical protein
VSATRHPQYKGVRVAVFDSNTRIDLCDLLGTSSAARVTQ